MSLDSAGASRGCFPPATSMAASGLGFGVHVRPATAPSMVLGRAGGVGRWQGHSLQALAHKAPPAASIAQARAHMPVDIGGFLAGNLACKSKSLDAREPKRAGLLHGMV